MKLHHRNLTTFEQVQHEIAACSTSNQRIGTIELTAEEFNEFVQGVTANIGHSAASAILDRGFFNGIAVKVYDELPDLIEAKTKLVEVGTTTMTEKLRSEKLTKTLDTIKTRASAKIIKEKA